MFFISVRCSVFLVDGIGWVGVFILYFVGVGVVIRVGWRLGDKDYCGVGLCN